MTLDQNDPFDVDVTGMGYMSRHAGYETEVELECILEDEGPAEGSHIQLVDQSGGLMRLANNRSVKLIVRGIQMRTRPFG